MDELRRAPVTAPDAPTPSFSYSQGIRHEQLLFISGQGPAEPLTGNVPSDFAAQVRQALANVDAIARAAGAGLSNAVRVGVYLADGNSFREMDAIYREYFSDPLPARTTITVGLQGILVEIDAIIALGVDS